MEATETPDASLTSVAFGRMPAYDPSNWYWRAEDGRLFGSKDGALLIEEDPGFVRWTDLGGVPTVWPRDLSGEQTRAELDSVLAAAGVLTAVPASVSSAQAKIALKRAGYLTAVKHVIDALGDEEIEIWFTDAREWERSNPHVLAVAAQVGLADPTHVDDLFRMAALIRA